MVVPLLETLFPPGAVTSLKQPAHRRGADDLSYDQLTPLASSHCCSKAAPLVTSLG